MSSTKLPKSKLFALVDCNNFYASCERVFHPKLERRPVVVLSNNDGCIIARSNEAKALGIPMGAPLFEWRELMERCKVAVCSSNYILYGDLSKRVMETLSQYSPDMQIYSIDEAFLHLDRKNCLQVAHQARYNVKKCTGIPVSIGLAPTKTLAKVANHIAKKDPSTKGVFLLEDQKAIRERLETLPVTEVWGIGKRLGERLAKFGIRYAQAFADADDLWIRRNFHVTGLRTAYELRGVSCLALEEATPPKKSICCSRSFSRPIEKIEELSEAVATYTARAAEKLRKDGSRASCITLFATLHPFTLHHTTNLQIVLPEPTHYTPHLLHYAKYALSKLFRPGYAYRKVGVILEGLVSGGSYQPNLFTPKRPTRSQEALMFRIDKINKGQRKKQLHFAAEGINPTWKMQQRRCTQRYTTRWDELLTIRI